MRSLPIIATALLAVAAPAFAMADPHAGHGDHGAHGAAPEGAIAAAVAAPTRTPANVARDAARHPTETLAFFGVKPGDTIVELWPGGGWYTEILAPLTQSGGGTLYAAAPWERGLNTIRKWQEAKPDAYGAVKLAEFPATGAGPKVPDGSADVVLTFRNVHNWRFGGMDKTAEAFQQIYAMLKPGGVLGVVDHRLPEAMDSALEEKSGYMKRSSKAARNDRPRAAAQRLCAGDIPDGRRGGRPVGPLGRTAAARDPAARWLSPVAQPAQAAARRPFPCHHRHRLPRDDGAVRRSRRRPADDVDQPGDPRELRTIVPHGPCP